MFEISKQRIIGFIAAIIYWFYSLTFRYKFHCPKDFDKFGVDKNILYAFWHQDDLCFIPSFKYNKFGIMVSLSKDGRILSTALEFFGFVTVAGSSSRRGVAALIQIIKMIRSGHNFAIAVDGPRGPIFKAKEGITVMSNKSKTPITPIRAFPKRYYMFDKAWNKPKLPMPFTRIDIVIGKPDFYNNEQLENAINSLSLKI